MRALLLATALVAAAPVASAIARPGQTAPPVQAAPARAPGQPVVGVRMVLDGAPIDDEALRQLLGVPADLLL